MGKRRSFTKEEDDFIRQHYATMCGRDIANHLNRTVSSIRHRADKINLPNKKPLRRWTKEEDEFILASKGGKLTDVARTLGRDLSDTSKRAKLLGISNWRRSDGHFYVNEHGYETRFEKQKPIYIHREVMEKSIGRKLTSEERVHHIDCDKRNNEISNLYLFRSPKEHALCHWSLWKVTNGETHRCKELLRMGAIHFNFDKGVYE